MRRLHTYAVRGITKHLQSFDSVRLERAVEDQETDEVQIGLDLVSRQFVDLEKSYKLDCGVS